MLKMFETHPLSELSSNRPSPREILQHPYQVLEYMYKVNFMAGTLRADVTGFLSCLFMAQLNRPGVRKADVTGLLPALEMACYCTDKRGGVGG